MESIALKSSLLMKNNSHLFSGDDMLCLSTINNTSDDDFPVEDLLNLEFSDDFYTENEPAHKRNSMDFASLLPPTNDFDSFSPGEFTLPFDEDLENLEWLSQFVDDSTTSAASLLCVAGSSTTENGRLWNSNKPRKAYFPAKVPGKARSKRSRENGRPWSLASPTLSSDESSSTSSSTILSHEMDGSFVVEKPAKRQKADAGLVSGRRCTHCQVQKTPQWRAGPLGPKTLCNACGVRFKSGRLFPEYRPACSPTFSQEIHSNSHRKVLEMRRRNHGAAEPVLTLPC